MKRIVALLLIICFTIPLAYSVSATTEDIQVSTSAIEYSAALNERYTDEYQSMFGVPNYTITNFGVNISSIASDGSITANITVAINQNLLALTATGNAQLYSGGYAGVLDTYISIDGLYKPMTVDFMYFSPNENFTVVSIGSIGESLPNAFFFGEYTHSISSISSCHTQAVTARQNAIAEFESTPSLVDSTSTSSVDATVRYQSTSTYSESGYELVTISLYHANELRNQSSMSVYAKVNSHTSSFESFLKNVHGYDAVLSSLIAYPDSFEIRIIPSDGYLHSNGVVQPTANSTSTTVSIPAYLPVVGFFTFSIPITMTTTTITYSPIAVSAVYSDSIIKWNVYKRYGWTPANMDGYYDDNSGAAVRAGYTYEGNVTREFETAMGATGKVRYEFIYSILDSPMTLHWWTEYALCSNVLTIVP